MSASPEYGRRRPQTAAETRRKTATGLGFARGLRLRGAEGAVHPEVATDGARVAGDSRNGGRDGGWSSGYQRRRATLDERAS